MSRPFARPVNHLLAQGAKMDYALSHADSGYAVQLEREARIARHPANQYLLLNSADRQIIVNSPTPGTVLLTATDPAYLQPWNNFRLQRPQALMEAYAKRIVVSECRFPWYVPNVNSYNNTFAIYQQLNGTSAAAITLNFTVPVGFYTPTNFASTVQALLSAATGAGAGQFKDAMTFTYDASSNKFTYAIPSMTAGNSTAIYFVANPTIQNMTYANFAASANFFALIGFPFGISGVKIFANPTLGTNSFTGSPTEFLYTEFVDVVSTKFHQFTNLRDGNSAPTSTAVLARIYVADEISLANVSPAFGWSPVVIHRQFKNPKAVRWNNEGVVDWLDIQVIDMYGNLVYIPSNTAVNTTTVGTNNFVSNNYPDFQFTLLASED
jgi:hypothetical protein